MIHKTEIEKYKGTPNDLVEEIGNLRYDALTNFLDKLAQKIEEDGQKDANRGRLKLATNLQNCANKLKESVKEIDKA